MCLIGDLITPLRNLRNRFRHNLHKLQYIYISSGPELQAPAAADREDSKQIKPFLKTQVSVLDNIYLENESLSEVLLKFLYLHFLSNKFLLLLLQTSVSK